MPLFNGVGPRIREALIKMGYRQADGEPDVRRFCREKDYDDTLFYFWIRDKNTPVKERARLARDLGMTEAELLFGVALKKATSRQGRGKVRSLLLGLTLGAAAAMWPSPSVPAEGGTILMESRVYGLHLIGSRRRRGFGLVAA